MANIGDLIFSLLADGSKLTQQVTAEAQKAGDAGAKTLGGRLSQGLATKGVQAFGLAASAAFGIAAKGALELENIQADLIAQTGMGADEAAAAAKAINRAAGENRMSLQAVRDIAIGVHNDLGLLGEDADAMTAKIAQFARVTKTDGVAAVQGLDDVTDAWSLSAEEQATVLDKLLVSQQRYGGSITQNLDMLGKLAPQLQALNADYDDGIGLLNLFSAAGLDSSKSVAALNKAVAGLKPGENLDTLIARISAIEDPTLRAQEAIKVFGSKGGVALANALKPGIDSLEDFAITTEDSVDAVDEAAEALDSTFSGRVQKAISQATAAMREFGASFGPALSGLASISILASSVFPGFGAKVGEALVRGIKVPVGAGKAAAVRIASAIAPHLAATASLIGEGLSAMMAKAIAVIPGAAAVKSAIVAAGTKIGTALGISSGVAFTAAFVAAAAAAVAAVAVVALDQQGKIDKMGEDLKRQAEEFARIAKDEDLARSIAGTREQLDRIPGNAYDAKNKVIAVLNILIAEQNRRALEGGQQGGGTYAEGFVEGVEGEAGNVERAGDAMMLDWVAKQKEQGKQGGEEVGEQTASGIVDGVISKRQRVGDAFDTLMDHVNNILRRGPRMARNIGILTGKELEKALHDRNPAIRREAEQVRDDAMAELEGMVKRGGTIGKKGMDALHDAIKNGGPGVSRRAQALLDRLKAVEKGAGNIGTRAGNQLTNNLQAEVRSVNVTVRAHVATSYAGHGRQHGGPILAGNPYWVNEQTRRSEMIVPSTSGHVVTHAEALKAIERGSGGDTYNIPVSVTGILAAETPEDLARPLRLLGAAGVITSSKQRRRVEVPSR